MSGHAAKGLVLRIPWKRGPAWATSGPVLVSVTVFKVNRIRDLPGAYLAGLRLRRRWQSLSGAVGLQLWARPWRRISGAVSIWNGEGDLRTFVALPEHVAVMRQYRHRATVTSQSWTTQGFVIGEIRKQVEERLLEKS